MVKKSHSPEEVINRLREVEILLNQEGNIRNTNRKIGVTEQTYQEKENTRLKKQDEFDEP